MATLGSRAIGGPMVAIDQAAACWLAAADGFASTGNAGSGSIGRYAVAPDGTLTALGSTLVENNPPSHPLDEGVSAGQNYLYVLANGLSQNGREVLERPEVRGARWSRSLPAATRASSNPAATVRSRTGRRSHCCFSPLALPSWLALR